MGQNSGHPGANVVAANNGCLPNLDAGNICDCVERSGRQDADLQTQIGGSRTARGRNCILCGRQCSRQKNHSNGQELISHTDSLRLNPGQVASRTFVRGGQEDIARDDP